jgi:hypothetical protein
MTNRAPEFTIFYTNFWYGPEIEFETLEEALTYAKSKGFDAAIRLNGETIGSWSIIGGYRKF